MNLKTIHFKRQTNSKKLCPDRKLKNSQLCLPDERKTAISHPVCKIH
jgi:hypothetical protein